MKLMYAPGACSLGIHVLLQEVGVPVELTPVALREGAQFKPDFVAVNPKSKVPALVRDDGSVLTEYGAIAAWIARTHPAAGLIPAAPEAEARAWEVLEYVVGTVHMQGFTRIARPGNFTPNEADHEAVRSRGREIYARGLALLDAGLEGRSFVAGETFSIADSALFYASYWAPRAEVALPPNVAAHFARMKARPAVQRAMAAEGLAA